MNRTELLPFISDFESLPRTTQLVRESGLRAFLLHLGASEEMPEHKAKGPITVQVLQGSVLFSTPEESLELISGSLIGVAGGVLHSLLARTATLMLVTMSE